MDLEVIPEDIVHKRVLVVLAEAELEMAELDKQTPEAVEAADFLAQELVHLITELVEVVVLVQSVVLVVPQQQHQEVLDLLLQMHL